MRVEGSSSRNTLSEQSNMKPEVKIEIRMQSKEGKVEAPKH